jgi:ribonuclease BN (tRNA processing enzyme)
VPSSARLTVVGCAGSAPGPESACSCYLVESDGYRLLLDLGAGASGPLQRYVAPGDVDAVVVSHAHTDHYADLSQLWRLRAVTDRAPLRVIGPSDLPHAAGAVARGAAGAVTPGPFDVTVARPGPVRLGPFEVRLGRVEHGECWAARIGDALCYTADTEPCPVVDELATGCHVLLADASGHDADGPLRGHLTAGDAARLAVRSGAKLLILTHLRPWQTHVDLLAEASAIADCPVILANPGLRVAL